MRTETRTFPIKSWVEFDLHHIHHRGLVLAQDGHGILIHWYAQRGSHRAWLPWHTPAGRSVVAS